MFIFCQVKISKKQHIICSFSESGKFYLLFHFQFIFFRDLYFRFFSFNQALIGNFNFLQEKFTSKLKFQFIFNLRRSFELLTLGSFFYSKKFGRINFSEFGSVYNISLLSLWNSVLCPVFEVYSDRFSLDFRPFRLSQDSFFFIKRNILNKKKNIFFTKFVYVLYPFVDKILFRSCFIPKFVLKSWLNFCILKQSENRFGNVFYSKYISDLYYNFFNFLISGLLSFKFP